MMGWDSKGKSQHQWKCLVPPLHHLPVKLLSARWNRSDHTQWSDGTWHRTNLDSHVLQFTVKKGLKSMKQFLFIFSKKSFVASRRQMWRKYFPSSFLSQFASVCPPLIMELNWCGFETRRRARDILCLGPRFYAWPAPEGQRPQHSLSSSCKYKIQKTCFHGFVHFDFTLNQLQRRETLTLTGRLQIKDFFPNPKHSVRGRGTCWSVW